MRIPNRPAAHKLHPVARMLLAVLLIAIFEGAIRKWLVQSSALPLLALRDGIVAYAIWRGIRMRWFRFKAWQEMLLAAWTAAVIFWTGLQVILQLQPPLIAILGLRSWLLYLWFAWLCSRTLSRADVERLLVLLGYLMIPMGVLAVLQNALPTGHFLNRSPEGDGTRVMEVVTGVVRTTGTFTFPSGYVMLTSVAVALALALLWGELKGMRSRVLRYGVIAAVFACVVVSGSRSAFLGAGIICLVSAACMVFSSKILNGRTIIVAAGILAAALSAPMIFPSAISSIAERFETASQSEDLEKRIASVAIGRNGSERSELSLLGQGIGMANNAAASLMGGERDFLIGETEADRMLGEAGLLGLLFIAIKVGLAIAGMLAAVRVLRRERTMLPLLLWTPTAMVLITGQITSQLSVHALGWSLLGLAWGSLNREAPLRRAVVRPVPGQAMRRFHQNVGSA